ncbi:MAG: DUF4097 family beta strand repeat protein [Acidobacteriota bacterium]|nr:DUF4097 family beta strand repeat protein [Acidobacteriota bacterium]
MTPRHRWTLAHAAALTGLLCLSGAGRALAGQDAAQFSRTVTVGAASSLTVSNLSGRITVTGTSGHEIRIDAAKRAGGGPARGSQLDDVNIDVAEHGDRVEVRTLYRGGSSHVSVDYTIAVPSDASVYLRSVSGDVKVSKVQGDVRAESVSGEVAVSDVTHLDKASSVSGDVSITRAAADTDLSTGSVSGNVTIRGLKAQGLDLSSVSGDLSLTDATCSRVSARTVSGRFTFEGPLAKNGRYEISSHSGDIQLRLTGATGFELNASSFSGDIDTDYPITIRDTEGAGRRTRHAIHGTFGDASALLSIRTFSGDISLKKQ